MDANTTEYEKNIREHQELLYGQSEMFESLILSYYKLMGIKPDEETLNQLCFTDIQFAQLLGILITAFIAPKDKAINDIAEAFQTFEDEYSARYGTIGYSYQEEFQFMMNRIILGYLTYRDRFERGGRED